MFVAGTDYLKTVRSILAEPGTVDVAVAFWGKGAEHLFPKRAGSWRVICNLASGASNPETISQLIKRPDIDVRQRDDLHAKLVVCGEAALIGSANFSTNGLQLEGDEMQGWDEAGLVTKEHRVVADAQTWFHARWDSAREITQDDLEHAAERWQRRRAARPAARKVDSMLDLTAEGVRDRRVFAVVWADEPSPGASDAYEEIVRQAKQSPDDPTWHSGLSFFEAWPNLPIDASLISFQVIANGKYFCDGIWRRVPELDIPASQHHDSIQIVVKESRILDMSAPAQRTLRALAKQYQHALDALWYQYKDQDSGGAVIPLEQVIEKLGSRTD